MESAASAKHWASEIESPEVRWNICLALSLIIVLLNGPDAWFMRGPSLGLAILALVSARLRNSALTWLALAIIVGSGVVYDWATSDNHKWLIGYWMLATACACWAKQDRQEILHANGRNLLILVMGLAAFYKATTPSYLSGDFFEFTLLTDSRFHGFTALLTDLNSWHLEENRSVVMQLLLGSEWDLVPRSLHRTESVRWLAWFLTWWTVVIEGSIALVFALPEKSRWHSLRHYLLLTFAVTTYMVAPVEGFGCMLMLLGMAQCQVKDRYFFMAYVVAFALIQVVGQMAETMWSIG
ncbi:hypothetical protein [Bremerella alba]|nr:hypothetical protein [Bremerella alba]